MPIPSSLVSERGASMVEYVLLVTLICMMGYASITGFVDVIGERVVESNDAIEVALHAESGG